jgi:hypothetical protein
VSGHPGQWKLANEHLVLNPIPPQMEVLLLDVRRLEDDADAIRLQWDGRTLERDVPPGG